MDWSNEPYVRLYSRDTATWRRLRGEGQAVLSLLMRKLDQAGVMDGIVDPYDDVSVAIGLPLEFVKTGLDNLFKNEVFLFKDDVIFMPNFMEAQTASKSDKQRQKESRDNRRAKADFVTKRDTVSQNVTDKSQKVTKCHDSSQAVTTGHSLHCSTMLDITMLSFSTELENKIFNSLQDNYKSHIEQIKPETVKKLVVNLSNDIYSGVDVPFQITKSKHWMDANPTRRKTARGLSKFLVSWIDRSQNNNRGNNQQPENNRPELQEWKG